MPPIIIKKIAILAIEVFIFYLLLFGVLRTELAEIHFILTHMIFVGAIVFIFVGISSKVERNPFEDFSQGNGLIATIFHAALSSIAIGIAEFIALRTFMGPGFNTALDDIFLALMFGIFSLPITLLASFLAARFFGQGRGTGTGD